jgi:hypothetical protein
LYSKRPAVTRARSAAAPAADILPGSTKQFTFTRSKIFPGTERDTPESPEYNRKRDLDILRASKAKVGITMLLTHGGRSARRWEPGASTLADRLAAAQSAENDPAKLLQSFLNHAGLTIG